LNEKAGERVMEYQTPQELFDALSGPFATTDIDWRVGSLTKDKSKGMALAYIDARTVADRLDAMCGIDAWQCNYTPTNNGSIVCNLGVKMPDGSWIWKADGAGATDYEAEKGMLSDAFKRAAVRFGVGRYLYGMDSPWVQVENEGRKIPDAERKRLDELHDKTAQRIGWGSPSDVAVYKFLLRIVQETVLQPSDVIAFREKNSGLIAQLRVAMRRHLEQVLDRVGNPETDQEAA
jgi:hypothetical protein